MHMHDPYSWIHNDLITSMQTDKAYYKSRIIKHKLFLLPFPHPCILPFVFFYTYHALKANSVKVFCTIVPKNICCAVWTRRTPILDFSYLFSCENKKMVSKTKTQKHNLNLKIYLSLQNN